MRSRSILPPVTLAFDASGEEPLTHHKKGERSYVEYRIRCQAAIYCNAATQAWLAVLRHAARRDDVDVAVRASQHAGNRTAGPTSQHPLHPGRRHRLHAAEQLPPTPDRR